MQSCNRLPSCLLIMRSYCSSNPTGSSSCSSQCDIILLNLRININYSKLCSWSFLSLGGCPMLDQCLYCLQGYFLLVLEWFDDGSGLGEHLWLYESLVTLNSVPVLAQRHIHQSLELLDILEWMRQISHVILLSELLISFFSVHLNTLHLAVHSLFLQFFDPLFLNGFSTFDSLNMSILIDTFTSPFIPTLFYLWSFYFLSKFIFNLLFLLFFKLIYSFLFILSHKQIFQ